jgi:hypothetical protein
MSRVFILHDATQGREVIGRVWAWAKGQVSEGRKVTLRVEEETRSGQQNKLLHALIQDISERREHAGQRWEPEVWKRLLTAAWCRARGEHVTIVPALDGHGIDVVFRKTSTLTVAECNELIEWITAWDATE